MAAFSYFTPHLQLMRLHARRLEGRLRFTKRHTVPERALIHAQVGIFRQIAVAGRWTGSKTAAACSRRSLGSFLTLSGGLRAFGASDLDGSDPSPRAPGPPPQSGSPVWASRAASVLWTRSDLGIEMWKHGRGSTGSVANEHPQTRPEWELPQ